MDNKRTGRVFVEIKENVAIIHMQCGENRFNEDFVNKICAALDEVERSIYSYFICYLLTF